MKTSVQPPPPPQNSNNLSLYTSLSFSLLLVSFVLLLAGCGGDKGTSETEPDGSSVDLAKDEAAMDLVQAKLDSLVGQHPAAIAQAALAYIQTLSEFKASGISEDGSVWAQFQDGVLYSIGTNDLDQYVQPSGDQASAAGKKSSAPSRPVGIAKSTGSIGEIPGSATAYVFNALESLRGIPADQIADQLTAAGYQVVRGTGSLADWRAVDNAGILFAACHGTRLPDDGKQVFYMQASDPHVKGDKTYLADMAAHRIAFDAVPVDDDTLVRGKLPKWHYESRYLFKAEYLSSHTMFADHGFMFNAACSGTSTPGLTFAQALKTRNNLAVYGGWSQPVYIPDDIESMLFFFDRALGINQFEPLDASNPPPAAWSKVLADMVANPRASGNGTNLNVSDPQLYIPIGLNPISVFSIQNLSGDDLSTLVPSITEATTDAANELLIFTGSFGNAIGRVKVDGSDVTVKTWTPEKISTSLPKASGKATILSKTGLLSNKVSVTVASNVSISPKSGGYLPGDEFTVQVSPSSGNGVTYAYHWKLTGSSLATMQDPSGKHTSFEFTSAEATVFVATTPSTQGTLTVSCTVSTGTGADSTFVGSASTDLKNYPYSNEILTLSSPYQSSPDHTKYFAYVLLKKDPAKTVAPLVRWTTYVDGTVKAVSSIQGTVMTKVYEVATTGDPNYGPPPITMTIKNTQLVDPNDPTFTYNDVPYSYDLGDAILLLVDFKSWDPAVDDGARNRGFVDSTVAKTQVVAGLVYP